METKKYQRKTACIPVIGWEHSKQITTMEYKYFVLINATQTQMIFFLEKEISTFTLNVNDTMCLPKYFHAAKEIETEQTVYICKC